MEANIVIRFFDKKLDFIGEVDDFTSFIFERKFFTYSEFKLVANGFDKLLFQAGNYVVINNDPYRAGQITTINIIDNEVTVKGFGLGFWFTDRITYPLQGKDTFYKNDYAENIMYELVKFNSINSTIANRNFENLISNTSQGRGLKLAFETRYKALSDELTSISTASKLGHCVKFDYKKKEFVFEVVQGVDKTVNQADNPPCIFSKRYDNIQELEYIKDISDYKTTAVVAGQGEGAAREIVVVNGDLVGQARKELFVDARDIESGSNLGDRGLSKLAEKAIVESFECSVDTNDYMNEWNLGDFVTILDDEIEVVSDVQVVEVREIYESGILTIEPVFGEPVTVFGDKFRQLIDSPIYENTKSIISNSIPESTAVRWMQLIKEEEY